MQKRFINYKASVDSFPLGEQHLGVFKPGRFNGFDVMETIDNISLSFTHSGKIVKADANGNGIAVYGVVITPTGTVIHQEDSIQVNLPANTNPPTGEPQFRTFILICEHNYQAVKGGVQASYYLVANPEGGKDPIPLPDNRSQVILGVVTKDYYTNALTYTKSLVPILGDQSAQDIYNLVKPFITIPTVEELPDVYQMIKDTLIMNQPRTIITGTFDIADDASGNNWTGLPYNSFLGDSPGHNLKNHTVKWKQTRVGSGNSFLDVEIATDENHDYNTELIWEWDNIRLIGLNFMNNPNAGQPLWAPIEVRDPTLVEGSIPGGSIKRFQLGELRSSTQVCSLRLSVINKYVGKIIPPEVIDFDIIS